MGCDSARAGRAVPAAALGAGINQCGDVLFLPSLGWERGRSTPRQQRAARHSSSLIPSFFLPLTAATISALYIF